MSAVFLMFATAYFFPFEYWPKIMAGILVVLFPVQVILWRLSHSRKAKDYLFCSSFLVVALVLQHYWQYADSIFYLAAMLVAAIVRYPIFLAIAGSSFGLELLRKYYYRLESL